MVRSCDTVSLAIADRKMCMVAFQDHEGRKLGDYDLINLIKEYRANVPEIKSHKGVTNYRYYLLTIAPIVVMAVPKPEGTYASSCVRLELAQGCLYDNYFTLNFRDAPPVMANSFWFSPDLKIPGRPIEVDAKVIDIPLGSSTLKLTSDGQQWSIRRDEVR